MSHMRSVEKVVHKMFPYFYVSDSNINRQMAKLITFQIYHLYDMLYIFIAWRQAVPLMLHALYISHTSPNRSSPNPSTLSNALSK